MRALSASCFVMFIGLGACSGMRHENTVLIGGQPQLSPLSAQHEKAVHAGVLSLASCEAITPVRWTLKGFLPRTRNPCPEVKHEVSTAEACSVLIATAAHPSFAEATARLINVGTIYDSRPNDDFKRIHNTWLIVDRFGHVVYGVDYAEGKQSYYCFENIPQSFDTALFLRLSSIVQ